MKFRMTKIATAVATGLGVSMIGMNVAQADALLFPYFAVSANMTTIFSVINTAPARDKTIKDEQSLHYRFYYKGAAAGLDDPCQEFDVYRRTSQNDVVTFDVGGRFGSDGSDGNGARGVMYEPFANQKKARYTESETFALMQGLSEELGGLRGVMIVGNEFSTNSLNQASYEGSLFGEAMLIDFNTGAAWGYSAYNAAPSVNTNDILSSYTSSNAGGPLHALNLADADLATLLGATTVIDNDLHTVYAQTSLAYDFSDRAETQGEVLAGNPGDMNSSSPVVPVAIPPIEGLPGSPDQAVTTAFFVTPIVHNAVLPAKYQFTDNAPPATNFAGPWQVVPAGNATDTMGYQLHQDKVRTSIKFSIQPWEQNDDNHVAYDRDESPLSGDATKTIRCVGRVNAQDLISQGVLRQWTYGGWTGVTVRSPGALANTGTLLSAQNPSTNYLVNAAPRNWRFVNDAINSNQAIVQKLEFSAANPGEFGGETLTGTYNTAIWLRTPGINRESIIAPTNCYDADPTGVVSTRCLATDKGYYNNVVERMKVHSFKTGPGKLPQDAAANYPAGLAISGGDGTGEGSVKQ